MLQDQDSDVRDTWGGTALFLAVENKDVLVVRLLIGNGVDVNLRDFKGETPLHVAVYGECEAMVQLLLENGADLSIQSRMERGYATQLSRWSPLVQGFPVEESEWKSIEGRKRDWNVFVIILPLSSSPRVSTPARSSSAQLKAGRWRENVPCRWLA
jgi:ankyrin repeat protein